MRMSDLNRSRGGIDKRCQVELKTDVAGTVVAASVLSDRRSALDDAQARVAQLVLRLVKRDLESSRLRQRGVKPGLKNALHPSSSPPVTPMRIMTDLMSKP